MCLQSFSLSLCASPDRCVSRLPLQGDEWSAWCCCDGGPVAEAEAARLCVILARLVATLCNRWYRGWDSNGQVEGHSSCSHSQLSSAPYCLTPTHTKTFAQVSCSLCTGSYTIVLWTQSTVHIVCLSLSVWNNFVQEQIHFNCNIKFFSQ